MKTTSKATSCEEYSNEGFKMGALYISEDGTILLCTKDTDHTEIYGAVVEGGERERSLGCVNNGYSWNATVFSPFYGEVTLKQTI